MNNTYYISADIKDNNSFNSFQLSQYNKGDIIYFKITCNGELFNINNSSAIFQISKNGVDLSKNCSVINNLVKLIITEDLTDTCGKFPYQIVLTSENTKITTTTNIIKIRKAVANGIFSNN